LTTTIAKCELRGKRNKFHLFKKSGGKFTRKATTPLPPLPTPARESGNVFRRLCKFLSSDQRVMKRLKPYLKKRLSKEEIY
jgi:hypothetical protein